MKYVNLTSHRIDVVDSKGCQLRTIDPSGIVARVKDKRKLATYTGHIPLYIASQSIIVGLPPKQEDTIYIVSQIVMRQLTAQRDDVVTPLPIRRYKNGLKGTEGFYKINKGETHGLQNIII